MSGESHDQSRKDARRTEIRALLRDAGVGLDESFNDDTSLIDSGLVDSLALFQLVLYVEEQLGPIDPNVVDIARELDSINLILKYLDGPARHAPFKQPTQVPKPALRNRGALEIVKYTSTYKHAVADLQTRLWSKDPERNLRYLEWKYEENPFRSEPEIFLAMRHGEVVGMRGFYGSRWEVGSQRIHHDILVADDLLVREDQRDHGVVHHLMHVALDDFKARGQDDFVFNLSASPITVVNSLAMGWHSAMPVEPLMRRSWGGELRRRLRTGIARLPPLRRYANSQTLFGRPERNPFIALDNYPRPIASSSGVRVEVSAQPRCEEMANLVGGTQRDGRIRHVRDAGYLRWRFRNPSRDYRFFYAGDQALDGYLVLARNAAGSPRVRIVDHEAIDDRTREGLLESATRPELFAEMEVWSATLSASDQSYLRRTGFESIGQRRAVHSRPCVLVRRLGDSPVTPPWNLAGVPLLDGRNWDLRMIFSMAG